MRWQIITTCMGRLEHLKEALPTWLAHTSADITVVDYGCPDGSGMWARHLGSPRVRTLFAPVKRADGHGPGVFHKCRALNWGLEDAVWRDQSDMIVFMDADTRVTKAFEFGYREVSREDESTDLILIAKPTHTHRELAGFLVAPRKALDRVRFDGSDHMLGASPHDLDFRLRLYLQSKLSGGKIFFLGLPDGYIEPISHSDELRTRFSPVSKTEAFQRGMQRLVENAEGLAGKSFRELTDEDPTVQWLLGTSTPDT